MERKHSTAAASGGESVPPDVPHTGPENGGVVTEVDTDTATRSFYSAKLCREDRSVFILQNIHYPYMAVARRDASGGFVLAGQPEWLQLWEASVRFLSPPELNQDWRGPKPGRTGADPLLEPANGGGDPL